MYNPALRSRSMLDLWRRRFNFLLWRRGRLLFRNRFRSGHRLAMGESAWARRFLAELLLPQGSVLAELGSLARHAGSAWVSFPASSPETVLRQGEESQKLAVEPAWVWRFLAALLLPQGSVLAALGSLARHAGWRRFRLLLLSRRCDGARSRRSWRWSRPGRGDLLRRCFYLRSRFWRR